MELYTERGFEQATVAEIAVRAGLTKRTFFRHYTDKRDVLFADSDAMRELVAKAVAEAPEQLTPIAAVAVGIQAAATVIQDNEERARYRRAVVAANPDLLERELAKLAEISAAMAETLRARGVPDRAASLCAEAGITAFKIAFECWADHPDQQDQQDLPRLVRNALGELRALMADA
jgi:AcrR family transcriptional regulator